MNYFNLYWCGNRLPLATAKSAAAWSNHLKTTAFLTALWVSDNIFKQLLQQQVGLYAEQWHEKIHCQLPARQRESYRELCSKVSRRRIFYWRYRQPGINDKFFYRMPMNVMVINIEGFFEDARAENNYFDTISLLFRLYNAHGFYQYVKDSTSEFLISHFGGIYCDVDILPQSGTVFFQNMQDLRNLTKGRSNILRYGTTLCLLHNNETKYRLDVGLLINFNTPISIKKNTKANQASSVIDEEKLLLEIKAYQTMVATESGTAVLKQKKEIETQFAQQYRDSIDKTHRELNKKYLQNLAKKSDSLTGLDQLNDAYQSVLEKDFDNIKTHPECNTGSYKRWLCFEYSEFYYTHIYPKFIHPDPCWDSTVEQTGFHYLRERMAAVSKIQRYWRDYRRHPRFVNGLWVSEI